MKLKELVLKLLNANRTRKVVLALFDVLCFAAADVLFYLIADRAANSMPVDDVKSFIINSLIQLVFVMGCRIIAGVYRNVWRYTSTMAYFALITADTVGGILELIFVRLAGNYVGMWRSVVVGSITALIALASRFIYSILYKKMTNSKAMDERLPLVIVGAGRMGAYLAGDLKNNPNSDYDPVFFVDTDKAKIGNRISNLNVFDPVTAEKRILETGIKHVVIAIANQSSEILSELYYHYEKLGCKVKVFDTLVGSDGTGKRTIRDFQIEDILFRKPIKIRNEKAFEFYKNKTILITGGGGSIGSELCRQVARHSPSKLVIFDIYENNAYDIQQELSGIYGEKLDLAVEIGSVRDKARLEEIFDTYKPDIVFHAAAHKHVPLMERSSAEAVKNNVLGTYYTADMAEKYGAEKFILISTDKAVNPTSVMGASKRVCEMMIQSRLDSKTNFAAVRFGNVLGSNGSVIPLFRRQIEKGGPVTITDKRIIRYFMTIPEASQLVMEAGAMANKGELFVLDMGKPVKIYDLADTMIRLLGLEPGKDIEIREVGLRPGEKLYEELLIKTEELNKTDNDLIFIEKDKPLSRSEVDRKIEILLEAVEKKTSIRKAMAQVVETFCDPDNVNKDVESTEEMKMICTQKE